jgi:hypothetical protein
VNGALREAEVERGRKMHDKKMREREMRFGDKVDPGGRSCC